MAKTLARIRNKHKQTGDRNGPLQPLLPLAQRDTDKENDIEVIRKLLADKARETEKLKKDLKQKEAVLKEVVWHACCKKPKPNTNQMKREELLFFSRP
jgi:hypothetical protein